jgi:hypothetical protein
MKFTKFALCPTMSAELGAGNSFRKDKLGLELDKNIAHINDEFLPHFDISEQIISQESPTLNNQNYIAKGMGLA